MTGLKRALVVALIVIGVGIPMTSAVGADTAPRLVHRHHVCQGAVGEGRFGRDARVVYRGVGAVPHSAWERLVKDQRCARGPERAAEVRLWRSLRSEHEQRVLTARLVKEYEPYYGCTQYGCGRWALPACIVNHESSGIVHNAEHPGLLEDGHVVEDGSSGLYQVLLSNWVNPEYDGLRYAPYPYEASKLDQSIVATEVLRSQGIHAWSTAAGCGY